MAVLNDESGMQFAIRNSKTGKEVKLAMEQLWLTGRVLPVGARLVLRHVFKSAEKKPLELVYTYGLPRDAKDFGGFHVRHALLHGGDRLEANLFLGGGSKGPRISLHGSQYTSTPTKMQDKLCPY